MARVPQYTSQVDVQTLPNARVSSEGVEQWASGVAANAQGVAALGEAVTAIARKSQKEADESQLMDFENKLVSFKAKFLGDPDAGAATVQGERAVGMTARMMVDWDRQTADLATNMTPRVRRRADAMRDQHGLQVRTALQGMELQQVDALHRQRAATGLERAREEAVLFRGNPSAIDNAAARAMQYATMDLERAGAPPETLDLERAKAASSIYRAEVEALIDDDTQAAESRLAAVRGRLTPTDQLLIDRRLLPIVTDRSGYSMAVSILSGFAPAAMGGTFDGPATQYRPSDELERLPPAERRLLRFNDDALNRYAAAVEDRYGLPPGLLNALKNAGERSNSGQVSPKGARGVMQFMPENLRKYGVIDPTDPLQSIEGAGRYLRDTMRQYGGNIAAVIADYNGGPGQAKRVAAGGEPGAEETRKYLARVSAAMGMRREMSPPGRHAVAITEDTKAETLYSMIPANASRKERQAAEGYIRDMLAARKAEISASAQAAASNVYDKVTGLPPFVPLSQVLSHDELALVGRDAKLSESINRYRKLLAQGQVVEDDPATLDGLYRLKFNDSRAFASANLAHYADKLSGKTLVGLREQQQQLAQGKRGPQIATEEQLLSIEFDKLGILDDPETKGVDETSIARGKYRSAWLLLKENFIAQTGKEPDDKATQQLLRSLTRGQLGGRLFDRMAPLTRDIPPGARQTIVDSYRRRFGVEPTELDVQSLYWSSKRGK